MIFPWSRRRDLPEEEWEDLSTTATRIEASVAKERASRSAVKAHSTASLVDAVTDKLDNLRTQNHFGEMIQQAMGERK